MRVEQFEVEHRRRWYDVPPEENYNMLVFGAFMSLVAGYIIQYFGLT